MSLAYNSEYDGEWVWRTIAKRHARVPRWGVGLGLNCPPPGATILGLRTRTVEGKSDVFGASLLTCLDGLEVYVPVG